MKVRKSILAGLITAVICMLLSLGGYALPEGQIGEHLESSARTLEREGTYPRMFGRIDGILDNWTDSIMLLSASYNGPETVLEKAFGNYHYEIPGKDPRESLVSLQENPEQGERVMYVRYWHGYVPFVKTMLLVTDYSGIRVVNQILQIGLAVLLMGLMIKRKLKAYCIPFLVGWLVMMPPVLNMSLQNSDVFYVMVIAMILLLLIGEKIKTTIGYPGFFLMIGIVINWIDFLTYPILTLIFPLILVMVMDPVTKGKRGIERVISCGAAWALGYGLMWALKWGLSTVILQQNILADAAGAAKFRLSSGNGPQVWSRWDTIKRNFWFLSSPIYWICTAGVIAISLILGRKNFIKAIKSRKHEILPFFMVAIMPLVWYCALNNHSYIHASFTHRAIAGMVFALLSLVVRVTTDQTK